MNELSQKIKIQTYFNKACESYDKHSDVQQQTSLKLISLLCSFKDNYNNIADFACGSGTSTQHLAKKLNYQNLYAVDFSENLLMLAKKKMEYFNLNFLLADFDQVLFSSRFLDLVFCNMGLQWSLNIQKTLAILINYLALNGVIVFSIPLTNTFNEIKSPYKNKFYNKNELINILENFKLKLLNYEELVVIKEYDSQFEALKSIKSTGANYNFDAKNSKNLTTTRSLHKYFLNHECKLTYEIGLFVAEKIYD